MALYFTHPSAAEHVTPPGHPEQVARIERIWDVLRGHDRREAPVGDVADVLRCHAERYVAKLQAAVPASGWTSLDADTHMAPASFDAAMRGVGGVCAAVDAVLGGEDRSAFVAMRPPGHHAERETAMGFCLFGNAAIAAKRALDHQGLSRVAVVDFDVHHGNGTQDLLWDEERVLFASSHQMPLYPGSGARGERGAHDNVLNVPLEPGSGSAAMRAAYENEVLPALAAFAPELVIVSAGFDAHAADPLSNLNWREDDFAWVTERICDLAERSAEGRVVSTLEGGYDLDALAASVAAHMGVLDARSQ